MIKGKKQWLSVICVLTAATVVSGCAGTATASDGGTHPSIAVSTHTNTSSSSNTEALRLIEHAEADLAKAKRLLSTPPTPPSSTTQTSKPPTSTTSPSTPPVTPPVGNGTAAERFGWGTPIAAGSDEFNDTVIDKSKWGLYDGKGHDGNGRRVSGNNVEGNGYLRQTGTPSGDSAGMASRFGQKYGKWEVRARSNGAAYHPVLILWPDSNQWPEGAEYDFLENSAPGGNCPEAFMHYPNHQPKRQEHKQICGVDMTQFHNYGIDWKPNLLVGYIDGKEWFRFTGQVANAPGPMHQTIQLDNFGPTGNATFDIDWARVYR